MVLHNPNNWHWVDKDVSTWTTEHLKQDLTGVSVEDKGVNVKITDVPSVEGDADVCQRKGKVITLFDLKIKLEFTAIVDEVEKTGSITIPEVSQDTEDIEDLVFETTVENANDHPAETDKIRDTIRTTLKPVLADKLIGLKATLIKNHGGDIQHGPGENPSANFPKAKVHEQAKVGTAGSTSTATKPQTSATSLVNVVTLSDRVEFRTTAEEVFKTFTDPARLAAFTRGKPKRFDGAKVGGRFELFDGNVSGEFVTLEEPKRVVQTWRLAQWPAGHYSTMTLKIEQNDNEGVTILNMDWAGVPVGHEDYSKRNWDEYYIRSIMQTFGFGTVL